ncbi:MAG: flagellar export chaperone FliS [Burkholderiales bacterium]|nr:flagellar export chaperone FliS [Burkholderiales bacterium]
MFATVTAPAPASRRTPASAYRQVGVDTGVAAATPHQLVLMLLDGFDDALLQAAGAMRDGVLALKVRALDRAVRIVDEGLKANLDLAEGGALAARLQALYGYVSLRLLHANLHDDAAALDECRRLMRPLRDAWAAIGPQVHTAPGSPR